MQKRTPILLFYFLVALVACSIKPVPARISDEPMERVAGFVRIDDEVIKQGDPYTIIDPVWWTANIYEGEKKYNESLASLPTFLRFDLHKVADAMALLLPQ